MSAGTAQLTISFVSTSAAGISVAENVSSVAIARTADTQTQATGVTSGTPNTVTAIALGLVAAASCWAWVVNTSTTAGQNIDLMWDDSGTKRVVVTIPPGCGGGGWIAGAPYIRCPSAASVPYDSLVASL